MDELLLVEQAQRGEVEAFNTLVLAHQRSAYNVAFRLLGDHHAATDATQEAFISAFNKLNQFHGGNFRAWLLRIVTNACLDDRRREKRRPSVSLEALSGDGDSEPRFVTAIETPEHIVTQHALSQAIQECLNGLSEDQRLVAVLSDVQGYEYGEISQMANVPVGTIKSRLSRARQALRECLQGAGELLPREYRLK